MRTSRQAASVEDIPTRTYLPPTSIIQFPFLCPCSPWVLLALLPLHLQRTEEIATLRESMLSLWSEEGPWPLTLGSKQVLMSLVRQWFFIKDVALGELVPVNSWGVYQAVRWAAESPGSPKGSNTATGGGGMLCMSYVSGQVASLEDSPLELGDPEKAWSELGNDPV